MKSGRSAGGEATAAGTAPAGASVPRRPRPQDAAEATWHLSSLELQEGLTVIEDGDDTVPGDLFDL